jgi:acyl CoA:acetate/3-ketoacid CoA transferase beta subunit
MTKHDGIASGWSRDQMAARAAQELRDGFYVNLESASPRFSPITCPPGSR